MPTQPRVSVVVPTRGDAPHLRSAVATAFSQGIDLEVIVACDVAAPFPEALLTDARVVRVETPVATPGGGRNAALAVARAPIVAFLDDDDLWMPGHIAAATEALDRDPALVAVACDAWLFDDPSPRGTAEPPAELNALPRFLGPGEALEPTAADLLTRNVLLTPAVVARREALVAAGGFDGGLAAMEDWDLWMRIARRGKIRVDREPRVIVRRRPDSASRDLRAMARCAIDVAERAQAAGLVLTDRARRALMGRLWHDLAYACLRAGDASGARQAATRAIALLPGRPKNYIYWLAGLAPEPLRRRVFGMGRQPESVS